MDKGIFLVIGLLIALGVGGYFIYKSYYSNKGQEKNTQTNTQKPGTNITIQNFAFNPQALQTKIGQTVKWTNQDSVTHRLKADIFNSKDLQNGDSFSFTFTKTGKYSYICSIHPTMRGVIEVQKQ